MSKILSYSMCRDMTEADDYICMGLDCKECPLNNSESLDAFVYETQVISIEDYELIIKEHNDD